jgi:hypothetical protein
VIILGFLLFSPDENDKTDNTQNEYEQIGTIMKEKNAEDMQHNLEVLSNDLKSSNFLTPRRVIQTVSNVLDIRVMKIKAKALQLFRIKEESNLHRVCENVISLQTIDVSTLLCRMGIHIFTLRKIII